MTFNLILKSIFAVCCHHVGALHYLRAKKYQNMAFVLMYHRVLGLRHDEQAFVQPGMYVTLETFRRQVAVLKERFHVLPLLELVERVKTGKNVDGCCAITFDDGWRDNFTYAFPVLKDFQIPATIFLATAFIGTNRMFWPEELTYYLTQPEFRATIGQTQVFARFLKEVGGSVTDSDFPDNAVIALKTWSPPKREELLQELRFAYPGFMSERLLMDWEEAREMQSSGLISFGAHTANHVILDQVSLQQAEEEIDSSRKAIEERLGIPPVLFAYPNGNFTPGMHSILNRNSFRAAVTTRKCWIKEDVNFFEIPRIGIHEDVSNTTSLFFARILLERF